MHTWADLSNKASTTSREYSYLRQESLNCYQELQAWSDLHQTSWFRVATSIVGLLVTAQSKPKPHHGQNLLVALGARPKGFEHCVSHMANTVGKIIRGEEPRLVI